MLTRIIEWSLRHRWTVVGAWTAIVVAGVLSFRALPIDAFPDTTPVQVQVNTVAPALAPLEAERQITIPVEQVLAGLPKVEDLRSISKFGLSQITVQFEDGTDLWFARQQVSERLSRLELPASIERPALGPVATGLGEVFHYLVKGKGKSLEEIRTAHDWIVAPQLRSVPGVAEVNAWGGNEKQWHVVVDPRRLQKFDLSLGDVYEALEKNNANVGGGVLDRGGTSRLVLGVGALTDARGIEGVVVAAHDGVPVRIRDVARVEVGREIRRAAVTADGEGEAVLGLGFMLVHENSHEVTKALAARLADVQKSLPAGITAEPVYERTELVDLVLRTVRNNLLEGALLVVAVLFAFLGNFRAGLIVASAIPVSLLFAFTGMLRFGIAGTLMSLGAIDFGLVVDSSVILVENAERRLGMEGGRRPVREVVRDAAIEVRKPTLFGELIIALVYLPILTLEGVEGKLFRPMALTVVLALLGSVLLSMTLAPVLASLALREGAHREPRWVGWLKRKYEPILAWTLAHSRWMLGVAAALIAVAAIGALRLGSEFVPRLSEGTIVVNVARLAEVSLDESVRMGERIEKVILAKFPDEAERVWTRTGTPEVATDPMGVELSDVFVALRPRERWKRAHTQAELVEAMRKELEVLPGERLAFTQPIEMRLNEMVAGIRSDLGVKLFGDDLDLLRAKAREVETVLRGIPGAADVTVEQVTGQPVLQVTVDRDAIARYGIPARSVLDATEAVGIRHVGEIREGDRRFALGVRLSEEFRDPDAFGAVQVPGPAGERIPLSRLTHVEEHSGPTTIQREWGKRRVVVQANVHGRDLGSFVAAAQKAIGERVELPEGYFVRFGGQFTNLERARTRLLVVVPIALALVFLLIHVSSGRLLDTLRIFSGVPFALVGGILALTLRGLPFSISAAVGFVALFGVAVLNGLVLVSRVRQLLDRGVALVEAVREAAISRLRPVLMTASVASLGFVPMALATGPGAEVQRPLATVVIGGVLSSTVLTLLVLPVLFTALRAKGDAERGEREEDSGTERDAERPGLAAAREERA
ncbi:efflux RND transporter permease subunit [Anaeromyxobacter terrae]|uniref:efflux RND transporter permease subunit n=1 Tax=Anaeromyxobacter terrae TaxID=2925406 RepID=UPI001F56EDC7|nr:CusA/CzcA family heavy metal efflux RND transporter [Anaeromyxobacter sp. SG22]